MNPFRRFLQLIPGQPTDKGQVIAVHTDGVTVQLLTGATVRVQGEAVIGDHVFIKGGQIAGPAPALTGIDQDV
ncbi:MAG: hypothetical protein ACNA7T_05145 [Haliea sp.]